MPATAYDAKGLMIAAIQDPNPVVFMDERLLYQGKTGSRRDLYVEIGKGASVRRERCYAHRGFTDGSRGDEGRRKLADEGWMLRSSI